VFEIDKADGFIVLTPLVKELTFKNSRNFLAQAKDKLEEEGTFNVILCMKNVEIIDSMSLGTLVAVLKYVKKLGGDLVITDLAEPIKVLFSLLNFTSVFHCYSSVGDAVAKFGQ
jgi:anti-anti-sigma factor